MTTLWVKTYIGWGAAKSIIQTSDISQTARPIKNLKESIAA